MAADLQYTSVFQKVSFGDYGLRVLTTGENSQAAEFFAAIQAVTDCTITFKSEAEAGDLNIVNLDLIAGLTIYGNLTDITMVAGKIIAYIR